MADMDVSESIASNLTNVKTDYEVDAKVTDGVGDQKETSYQIKNWSKWFGYYKTIPELNTTIDARATWTVGKGYTADEATTIYLDKIRGWGTDTFNTILENMIRTMHICGDAFCEIMRDDNIMVNLKPLDPSTIVTVVNQKGIIIRYEQTSKVKKANKKFKPEDIFHLSRNRVADEIHGVSVVEKLERIILMRNEAMEDYKTVMHRFVTPRWIIKLDTDDATLVAAEKVKWDDANEKGENMYIPMGSAEVEQMAISPNATLNPQSWIDSLNDYFYEACATPRIIVGNSKNFTEASAKIVYLAFQQSVEEDQLYIEEEVANQLNVIIKLEFPASLENELLSDESKDEENGAAKPEDTTAAPVEPNG